jgi:outer membrane protein OmpA-like peptidoglycan-associated protein
MMKRILISLTLLLAIATGVNAQNFLNRLRDRAVNAVTNTIENKVENAAQEATEDALSGKKSKKNNDADDEDAYEEETPSKQKKTAKGEEVKSDFVAGTTVIFQDDLAREKMGEFPSKWDLIENNVEVARMNGKMAIKFEHGSSTEITPLLENDNKEYLPEVYSLEFDFFVTGKEDHTSAYKLVLHPADGGDDSDVFIGRENINWRIMKPNGTDIVDGNASIEDMIEVNDWNHFALSFNKRALKVYINDKRFINIPNAKAMDWFSLCTEFWEDHIDYITNIRLAKGGGELYDRDAQTMTAVEKAIAETGKFVTNNILFDTGKATLKAESMAEIQKVADYMKKNPNVRFEVQGHTDNQGSDAVNDPLSQQRAEAIVKALEGLGVDGFNLKAVGKGSHEPVADNKTEAGRAKNRRVEFIKK